MTPENFVYWLQGYMEINDPKSLGEKETQIIKDHLQLVLKKETPTYSAVNGGIYGPIKSSESVSDFKMPNTVLCAGESFTQASPGLFGQPDGPVTIIDIAKSPSPVMGTC